ncbi:hypothetical protein HPB51_016588 [Rhipicephalus microplus]|uniref:Uncharacterized protein n=1 Tax=Rhipicephalus microplus TaxID=6941 RepID=A0A9J6E2N2_RHIMP|nr:hypothetical protein HPB51_016588 [Rhipicephalus microplus]
MSMQVAVDGEDISPEELQSPGWTMAVNRWKVKTVPDATGEAPRAKPGVATVSQPRLPTNVKKQVIAASRRSQLPKDHLRVIVRPRNGLGMRHVNQIKFAFALTKVANLGEEEIAENVVCPNFMQNIAVVSTPTKTNARAYASISSVVLGSVEYEVNAYIAASDDTCKEVIRGVALDIDPVKFQALSVHERDTAALKQSESKPRKRWTSSDRITTPGAEKEPWATKAKKTSQPQVKGGADSEHVSFELVSSIQKENATLRSNVKQLKAEIAEIKGSKVVNAAPPSWPNRHVENIGESRIAEVSMDTHSEVRTAERKATTEHMRNEELDFKVQTTSSLAEIKETLKQMTVAMASLGARTSKLEEELSKLRAKKGVKLLVKSRATSLGVTYGSTQAESAHITNDSCE